MSDVRLRRSLGPYRAQWDLLVKARSPRPLHLRSWWVEGIATSHTGFVLVVEGGRLLGGLALDIRRTLGVARIQLAGQEFLPTNDDLLAVPEAAALVTEQLREWFHGLGNALVDVRGLGESSLLRAAMPQTAEEILLAGAPYLDLSTGFDAYVAQRSKNWRSSYRKAVRRLEREGCRYEWIPADEVERALDTLRRLHVRQFGGDSQFLPYYERFAAAARGGSTIGEIGFYAIYRDDDAIAIEAVIEVGDCAMDYQAGRVTDDERFTGAGTAIAGRLIQDLCSRGVRMLDLGWHADEYKLRMASGVHPVKQVLGSWGAVSPWVAHGLDAHRWVRLKARGARTRLRVGRPEPTTTGRR